MAERIAESGHAIFDWAAAHRRLDLARRKLDAVGMFSPSDAAKILDERARALARPLVVPDLTDMLTVILFAVGAENYAIEAQYVREVTRMDDLLPLPGMPAFVLGAAKFRGEIHAVFDICALSGGMAATPLPTSKLLIVGREHFEFGLIADAVTSVSTLSAADIIVQENPRDGGTKSYLRGATRDAISVIDGVALLDDTNLYFGGYVDQHRENDYGA